MAYTKHGHHIPGTVKESTDLLKVTARCGGPSLCGSCARDVVVELMEMNKEQARTQSVVVHDDMTLFKVSKALEKSGLTEEQIMRSINQMLNAGILFRERLGNG